MVLYIILGILIVLFLLTMLNVVLYAEYDEEMKLAVRIAFVKIQLLPPKPKKEKPNKPPKKKKKQEKKPEKTEEKKPSFVKQLYKERGLSGIINIIKQLAELAVGTLKELFSHIVVTDLRLNLRIAGGDAADSAVKYGKVCAAVFPALRVITEVVKVKKYDVNVNPDFSAEPETKVYARVKARIRIIFLLKLAISKGIAALKIFMNLRKSNEKEK